ncbi:TIGR03936 family radical SAM-associated protein, partial [Clostridioides difficile]
TIATGSKTNLNTNILIPKMLEMFELDIDPLDVDILRRDLYVLEDGELVTPM